MIMIIKIMNKIEKLTGANYKALININPYT